MPYRFLIYFSYTYAIPIAEPLEREIERLGYEVKWFADHKEGQEGILQKENVLHTIESALEYAPHVILCITDSCPDFFNSLKVQVFHGFNAEKRKSTIDHFNIRGLFDLYCTQGPSTTSIFKELKKQYNHFNVIETGWSKVDPMFPLQKDNNNPVPRIFVASTFSSRLSMALDPEVFSEIKKLSLTGKYHFDMVLHPKLEESVKEKWKTLEGAFFTYHDTTSFIPLMKRADMMMCDTTSVVQEFGLLEKPIVTFRHRVPRPHHINVTIIQDIEPALDRALTKSQDLVENLKIFNAALHPYQDGKSSGRVIQVCINQLHATKNDLKKKPLNLVRKWKVRKTLQYFTLKSYNKPFHLPDWSNRQPLTAILPVGNEIDNIQEVIDSVSFADEILVIDSMSTDGTHDIAQTKNVRIIRRPYEYSSSQKNFAIPLASHEWVLLVDADERVTPKLKDEILIKLINPSVNGNVAYWIGRTNHFMNKRIRHSGLRNDKVIRLFMRDKCRYEDKMVHAEIVADGKVGTLKNKFYHNTYRGIDEFIEKMNRYSGWQAVDYDKTTGTLTPFHFVLKPIYRFTKHYVIQLGFLDGMVGLFIAYLHAYMVYMRYLKLWLLRRNLK
ncbi:glycosyltransferase [Nonlabens antarcticus]|uniref:glycosyltransferase n=1 Tax=Nonlabens antarcticus TaxID=392714 RepID=UPI001E5DDF90|nr:glycosyltransferase [Nonlabens antarcticus]